MKLTNEFSNMCRFTERLIVENDLKSNEQLGCHFHKIIAELFDLIINNTF